MNLGKVFILTILVGILLGVGVSASVEISKSSYNYDIWTYKEDTHGKIKGFVLSHVWSSPSYEINDNSISGLVNWRSYNIDTEPLRDSYVGLGLAFNKYGLNKKTYSGYSNHNSGYYIPNFW